MAQSMPDRPVLSPVAPDLRERFSALFANLAREEDALKNVLSQNELMEKQLQAVRRSRRLPPAFDHEVADLRQEALVAEQRCALESGEAGALAAASATYERQCARLQERCQAEASQERAATESLGKNASEMHNLKAECHELSSQLEGMEAHRQKVLRDFQQLQEASRRTATKSKEVQGQVLEQKAKAQKLQEEAARDMQELAALDKLVDSKKTDVEYSKRWLAEEREAALQSETRHREQVGRRTRYEEELSSLSSQLDQCRKDGSELQAQLDATIKEAAVLQDKLRLEEQRHRSELEAAEASKAQKERLEAELKGAEAAKADVEKELGDLRKLAADLVEQCASQRRWRDEQAQKQATQQLASERLRKEIQQLHTEQARLQHEAKMTMQDRNRLEVELQVAKPALEEARRRCKDLEYRLVSRVRELSDETERVRRLQLEAEVAKSRLAAVEGQNSLAVRKLEELSSPDKAITGSPPKPPILKEPRGDLSGRWSRGDGKTRNATIAAIAPEGMGNTTGVGPIGIDSTDSMRFLCEYVAKEEARLGLPAPR
ncbi:unnamed protein product [Durusdinium trenchii]|uniref:Uncharacterized protein n=2 Tax=Durusdinium trenchii TaxID=1381693 RepID=A0ABP0MUP8_9DINO